ncbi:MAG: glycosyltransferase family 4 protein [Gemmatimonadota bacterium]|nr:glycosyltransferase family 4 protein [Gemmatimonadota bacterium]
MKPGSGRILVLYSWPRLWSMGPGRGSPDFYLSLKSLAGRFERVKVVCPTGEKTLDGLPGGIEAAGFGWPGGGRVIGTPSWLLKGKFKWVKKAIRACVFAVNWKIRFFSYLVFTIAAYRAGRRAATGLDPAIIAAYGYMAAPAGRLLAARLNVPLVIRLFGNSLGLKGFSLFAQAAQFEEALAYRLSAERWVITNDGSCGDEAARRLGVPESRVCCLLNGVDRPVPERLGKFDRGAYRRHLGLAPETRVLLRVCRLWSQQRVDRMIRLMPGKLPDGTPVAAVVAGQGPERERLEQLAEKTGKKVIFTGALDHGQLTEHLCCADLYIATSDRTNLSNSVLEALCHGLPVVALAAGRTGDVISDGVNGRLLPLEEKGELCRVIEDLLAEEQSRSRMSRGALETAREKIPDFEQRMRLEAAAVSLDDLPAVISNRSE